MKSFACWLSRHRDTRRRSINTITTTPTGSRQFESQSIKTIISRKSIISITVYGREGGESGCQSIKSITANITARRVVGWSVGHQVRSLVHSQSLQSVKSPAHLPTHSLTHCCSPTFFVALTPFTHFTHTSLTHSLTHCRCIAWCPYLVLPVIST